MWLNRSEVLSKLKEHDAPFSNLFEHGSLSVEVYPPKESDLQQPHEQDELFVIISGGCEFLDRGTRVSFNPEDFPFGPADVEHQFENFSTWAIYHGPKGGKIES